MKHSNRLILLFSMMTVFTAILNTSCSHDTPEEVTFKVTYETEYGIVPKELILTENSTLSEEQLPQLVSDDYIFSGWYDGEKKVEAGTYKIIKNVKLTAKWIPITYTVTYISEYGTVPTQIRVKVNTVLNSEQLISLNDEYQIFYGWFDGDVKAEAGSYIVKKNTILKARWNVRTHIVTFQPNNGNEKFIQTVKHGSKLTIPTTPVKEETVSTSYKFAGWYISTDNGTTLSDTIFDFSNTQITAPITLFAKWTESPINYTVTFDSKGGSGVTSQTVRGGGNATEPVLSPTKTATVSTSYTFAGWFASSDNGITFSNTSFDFQNTTITRDITLYAKWTETAINYTVTFDSKGGSSVASILVRGGNKVSKPTNPTKPSTVSTSYIFAGWFTSTDNGTTLSNTTFDFVNTTITAPIALYAKWTETPVYYTVTFDSKGGSSVDSLQLRWGDTITRPSDPTKEQFGLTSYTFVNWYTSLDNGVTLSNTAFNFVNTTITGAITLYAKWAETQSEYQFHETVEYLPRYTDGTAGTTGKYVLFGDWPQTIKAANVTVNENQSMTMGDFTYYKGSDGYWYAKCTENASAGNPIYSDGTPVAKASANSFKYFKVEPIKWRILNPYKTDTEKPFLLAERILTAHCYAKKETSGKGQNYYQYSEIRTYLNTTFLNGGFTTNAQNLIQKTRYDNSARSTNPASNATLWNNGENPNTCPNNPDKIFLLSVQEVTKSAYGFAAYDKEDITRIRVPTDYAKANNCGWHDSQTSVGYSYSWWLRSPYYDSTVHVHIISPYGREQDTGWYADSNYYGVVPSLCLN